VHAYTLNLALVFSPLQLPVYVALWCFEWLLPRQIGEREHVPLVRLIESVSRARAGVMQRRVLVNSVAVGDSARTRSPRQRLRESGCVIV
jgi:hypothetical protein